MSLQPDTLTSMTNITAIAPQSDFDAAIKDGRITASEHATAPYVIYNYSRSTQFNRTWDVITVNSRGLIVHKDTGEIIARPFPKFFNDEEDAGEWTQFPRTGKVVVTDKADGSLGILYRLPDGSWAVSTRGSMNSVHAHYATALYHEKYDGTWTPREDITYLFEIINPDHPIVLNYGETRALILLGAVDKATGRTLTVAEARGNWKGEVVEEYPADSYENALKIDIPDDREGVVVHFIDSDARVKLKGDEYKRLHAILTNTTPLDVWRKIRDNESIDEWLANNVPEEFESSIRRVYDVLMSKMNAYIDEAGTYYAKVIERVGDNADRKTIASVAGNSSVVPRKYLAVVWRMVDNRTREEILRGRDVIDSARPDGDDSFAVFFRKNAEWVQED